MPTSVKVTSGKSAAVFNTYHKIASISR